MTDQATRAPSRTWLSPSAALSRPVPGDGPVAAREPVRARNARYGVRIGGIGVLLPPNLVSEVVERSVVYPVPGTPPWLEGLLNLRGNLVPVFDLARALDEDGDPRTVTVVVGRDAAAFGLRVAGLPRLANLDRPLTRIPPVPEVLSPHLRASFADDDRLWLELDLPALLESLGGATPH